MQFIRVYLVLTESLTRVIFHHVLVVAIGRGQVHSRRSKRQQGGQAPGIQTGRVTGTTHAPNSHRTKLVYLSSVFYFLANHFGKADQEPRIRFEEQYRYTYTMRSTRITVTSHRTNYLVFLHSFGFTSLPPLYNHRQSSSKGDIHLSTSTPRFRVCTYD